MLDRVCDTVAGRVDTIDPGHRAVVVDRDEAITVVGQAGDRFTAEPRQGDDLVGLDALATVQPDATVIECDRGVPSAQTYAAVAAEVTDVSRGRGPERCKWLDLGRHYGQLHAAVLGVADVRPRQSAGQLVEG